MDGNGIFFYGSPHQNIGTLLFIAKLYGLQEVRGQVQGNRWNRRWRPWLPRLGGSIVTWDHQLAEGRRCDHRTLDGEKASGKHVSRFPSRMPDELMGKYGKIMKNLTSTQQNPRHKGGMGQSSVKDFRFTTRESPTSVSRCTRLFSSWTRVTFAFIMDFAPSAAAGTTSGLSGISPAAPTWVIANMVENVENHWHPANFKTFGFVLQYN